MILAIQMQMTGIMALTITETMQQVMPPITEMKIIRQTTVQIIRQITPELSQKTVWQMIT